MSLAERYDLSDLTNQMEDFVFQELESQLNAIADEDICKCNDCILDMACFALNNLTPKYRSSLIGSLYAKVESREVHVGVQKNVAQAIQKISQNPLCGNV
ncbi:MAG: late competence development ComFB family protein [Spirochaetaceae bacterium]|nr:late competence development ComFB family protein [Spirochaetaceae bacterium]MDT8298915.1 late competence development ComFB family protein [Spirochaetaceae bacterium]